VAVTPFPGRIRVNNVRLARQIIISRLLPTGMLFGQGFKDSFRSFSPFSHHPSPITTHFTELPTFGFPFHYVNFEIVFFILPLTLVSLCFLLRGLKNRKKESKKQMPTRWLG